MKIFNAHNFILLFFIFLIPNLILAQGISLVFNNSVGVQPLTLNSTKYSNSKNQDFSISSLRYYISNISIADATGKIFYVDSSFLIDESKPESKRISLNNSQSGNYQSIEFIVGVDSLHNCSGAQSGSLDPLNGMFWTWNSGYIFFKLEGKSSYSNLPENLIEYHIGGYKTPNNNIRKINLQLDSKKTTEILLNADIEKLFSSNDEIDFTETPSITTTTKAHLIANQFSGMFTVEKQE